MSMQTPPFKHGSESHRSAFMLHRLPTKPFGHLHSKSLTKSWQIAPSAQGFSLQSSVKN